MKKFISAALTTVMAASCATGLVGCGKSGNTLRWIQLGDMQPRHEAIMEKVNEIVEDELGMKVEIEYIDTASFNEKAKMKMASGDNYDIIWTGYCNDYYSAVNLGGLMDITDYIDNIKMSDGTTVKMSDVIDKFELDSATVNGKIYGIPNMQIASNPLTLSMRKSVAEECGVDLEGLQALATSIKDAAGAKAYMEKLTSELEKIHAKRPDLYAINPGADFSSKNVYEEIVGGIGVRRDGTSTELVNIRNSEEFKVGVDYVNQWYQKGYIRSDIASKGNALTSTDEKKQCAVIQDTWKPGQDVSDEIEFGEPIVYSLMTEPYVGRANPVATMLSIGKDSKHPEEAVKLIYMLNTNKELHNLLCWGIEGEDYTLNSDGTVKEIENSGYDEVGVNAWRYGNQFIGYVTEGQPADVWEQMKTMNDNAVKSPALGFVPETDSITTELANITNVNSEYKAKVEMGTAPREEYWDEYMSKLKEAGIDKVLSELQSQYDEFIAQKN